jgi:LysM repeat protein
VVDRDGTVAESTTLTSWKRVGTLPGVSATNAVDQFGQSESGALAALLEDGSAYESADGVTWTSLAVPTTEVAQDVVTRHVVVAGDTVWRISRANGVSVSSVVAENNLPRGGALIRIGQTLTMTKRGVVKTVDSPVTLDPSIVISGGSAAEEAPAEQATPVAEAADETPAEPSDSDSEPVVADSSEGASESDSEGDAPLPALEPLVSESSTNDVLYTVAKGDTLIRIAFRNTTTVSRLVEDNNIANPNRIYQGQRLKVGETTTTLTFHRAQADDTLERIGERRSVSLEVLATLNPSLEKGAEITPGVKVRVS